MESAIIIASDHAGYYLKRDLIEYIQSKGLEVIDLGADSDESVDYPNFGHALGERIERGESKIGISICGSGNGINMVTNKHRGLRAAICWNEEIAEMARKHNDANVCSLPARFIDLEMAKNIVDIFLSTGFDGGRHERRINMIDL